MKFFSRIIVLFATIVFVQGCSPVDDVSSQGTDLGKNIIISRDSVENLDPVLVKQMVIGVIEVDKVASVIVNVQRGVLYCLINSADTWSTEFLQIFFRGTSSVYNVEYKTYYPASASRSDFYASCPNSSMETYWTTECSTISSSVSAINTNNSNAQSRGYVTTKAIGSGESLSNVNNYLSCSGLKVWGRVGHGYTGGLQLAGGQMLGSFSMNLDGHGIYANSCQAYNNPFKSKVMNAGAEWFVSGITNLYIGPSEAVFKCTMQKALSQTNVCSALDSCMQSNAGKHGCGGPNQVIPAPGGGGGGGPTPTPGPGPTPSPGNSCANSSGGDYCGKKSPDGCWCDNLCSQYGDCCPDYDQVCNGSGPNPTPTPQPTSTPTPAPTSTPTPGNSCASSSGGDYCGKKSPDGCWCDNLCSQYGDCCPDYDQVCNGSGPNPTPTPQPTSTPTPAPTSTPTPAPTPTPTPGNSCASSSGGDYCGKKSPDGCWCDNLCSQYGDCCPDYEQVCNGSGPNPTPPPGENDCMDCHPNAHYPDQDCYSCHPGG